MNTFRLLTLVAAIVAAGPVLADRVNTCSDPSGRKTMTDRPCADPSMKRFQEQRTQQIAVDQIQAKDMFSARTKVRNDGQPISPDALDGDGAPSNQGRSALY